MASAAGLSILNECEPESGPVDLDPTIETGATAGMAGAAVAAHLNKGDERVLIAVDPHFDEALGLAGGVAFAPERPA